MNNALRYLLISPGVQLPDAVYESLEKLEYHIIFWKKESDLETLTTEQCIVLVHEEHLKTVNPLALFGHRLILVLDPTREQILNYPCLDFNHPKAVTTRWV
ncbi:MAG: hypothetical protein AABZ60_06620, partial [Planctomycetota bacterium]